MKNKFISFLVFYGLELIFHFIIAFVFYLIDCAKNPRITYTNDIVSIIIGAIVYVNVFRLIGGEIIIKVVLEYLTVNYWYKFLLSTLACFIFVLVVEYHTNNHEISFNLNLIFHPSFGWTFHLPLAVICVNFLRIARQRINP